MSPIKCPKFLLRTSHTLQDTASAGAVEALNLCELAKLVAARAAPERGAANECRGATTNFGAKLNGYSFHSARFSLCEFPSRYFGGSITQAASRVQRVRVDSLLTSLPPSQRPALMAFTYEKIPPEFGEQILL